MFQVVTQGRPKKPAFRPSHAVWVWVAVQAICASALANERIALVIGNSDYRGSPLVNPRNDANAMADLLVKAGFKVDKQLDTDLTHMQAAVDKFGKDIIDPKVKFGLFYYAGHGLQQDWRNYLVPVSANIRVAAEVPRQTLDVSNVLRYMEKATGRSFLVILDACRDDPFGGSFNPQAKGLSQFDAPSGSLLAYATAPGNVAQDGAGQNGLYTGYLLREFAVPGARLEDALKRVRISVRLASRGKQVPWETTSLEEDLYLFPLVTRRLSEADRDRLLEQEMTTWLRVKSSLDPVVLAGFISEYPSGSASELAQSRLNRLLAQEVAREDQRLAAVAGTAGQAATLLAEREVARKEAAAALQRQQQAQRAEEERVRLAQLDLQRQEAARAQSAREAAALAEAARLSAEQARLAQLESQRLAAAQQEAARQQALADQAALDEAQRQAAVRLAAAKHEAARLAAAQQEAARLLAAQQAATRQEAARQEAARVAAAQQEAARLAASQQDAARLARIEQEAQRLAAQREEATRQAAWLQEAQRLAVLRQQDETVRVAAAEQEARRLAAVQQEAARQAALQQQEAARLAAAQQEAARVAAAEREATRVALARQETERLVAANREVARQQEAARQSALQALAAQAQAQGMQNEKLVREAEERTKVLAAEQQRATLVAVAQQKQQEAARLAAAAQAAQAALASAASSTPSATSTSPAPVLVAAATPATLSATPYYKGYAEHQRRFSTGDQFNIRVIDQFNKSVKPLVMKVTQVDADADRVVYNDGEFVSDLMGNTTANRNAVFNSPRQFYPADLFVGKKWQTRFKQPRPGGVIFTFQYDLKVTAIERVTVPAGTFEAFKIEARGFNLELGASIKRTIWVAPGVSADIVHEIKVRLRDGRFEQNERQELESYTLARR